MKKVTIYTADYCPYCERAKALLASKKIAFKEIDVSLDKDFDALVKKTGWKTVPQIFFGDELIGGCQDLIDLDQKGQLDQRLGHSRVAS